MNLNSNSYRVFLMSLPSAGAKIQWPNIIPIAEVISAKTPHGAVEHCLAKVDNDVVDAAVALDVETNRITRFAVSKTKELEQMNVMIKPRYALSFVYRENGHYVVVPFSTDMDSSRFH